MKWIWVIVLVIVGAIAAYVAIEYLTVSIHSLPSFIPGHRAHLANGKVPHGHYHKRGAVAALIALVAFAVAGFLTFRIIRADRAGGSTGSAGGSSAADQLV